MSQTTRVFDRKVFMLYEAGYTHDQAKRRAKMLRDKIQRRQNSGIRIAPAEGSWGIWIETRRDSEAERHPERARQEEYPAYYQYRRNFFTS